MAAVSGLAGADAPDAGQGRQQARRRERYPPHRGLRRQGQRQGSRRRLEQAKRRAHHHDLRRRPQCDRTDDGRPFEHRYGTEPTVVQDIRRVLDDKSIDAISIATPNHWHALATIWACQAGKDVYVEKPVSHNVTEGRRMVEAARKYDRIVQTGTQCRSHQGIQDAMAFLRSGKLGQIYMAKGLCYKPRGRSDTRPTPGPRKESTTTSGSARPPSGRSTPTGSTTTGTGTGTTATATSATRASIKWTWPAGAWTRTSYPRP